MKNFTLLALLFTSFIFSQKMQLTYKAKIVKPMKVSGIASSYIKMGETEVEDLVYILKIQNKESLWFLQDRDSYLTSHIGSALGGTESYYSNLAENQSIVQKKFVDEFYIVKSEVENKPWTLQDETKEILGYTCKKAIIEKTTTINDSIKTFKTTAWYYPELPEKFGVKEYVGLKGLVLELCYNDYITYYCTEIVADDSKLPFFILTKPTGGKEVTDEEYSKAIEDKMRSLGLDPKR